MMTNEALWLSGSLLILVLAIIAVYYHWQLYQMRKSREQELVVAAEKAHKQSMDIKRSIHFIARALEAEQVGLTEASIRISVLLDALQVDNTVKSEFSAFYKLADDASHIPILDAWKSLSKAKRAEFSREIQAMEEQCHDSVMDAARRIQGRDL